jgi:hypothetical protein
MRYVAVGMMGILLCTTMAQAADEAWQRLKIVGPTEVKVEVDKAVRDAGLEFSEWRWLEKKTIVARVRSTKGPLASSSLQYTKYNAKNISLGLGRLVSNDLKKNESSVAIVGVTIVGRDKTTRVVISLVKKKEE